jgi:hypothetical protein
VEEAASLCNQPTGTIRRSQTELAGIAFEALLLELNGNLRRMKDANYELNTQLVLKRSIMLAEPGKS